MPEKPFSFANSIICFSVCPDPSRMHTENIDPVIIFERIEKIHRRHIQRSLSHAVIDHISPITSGNASRFGGNIDDQGCIITFFSIG